MTIKSALVTLLFALFGTAALQAQNTMREWLANAPDTLFTLLTRNDRLDLIDTYEAGQKAEVTNRLGGTTTLSRLTADEAELQFGTDVNVHITFTDDQRRSVAVTTTLTLSDGSQRKIHKSHSTR